MRNILTNTEKERLRRHKQIMRLWDKLHTDQPDCTRNAAFSYIADKMHMSVSGVRKIVVLHTKQLESCAMDG